MYNSKVRKNTGGQNHKKYVCSFQNCQKSYSLKNILLAHLRTHYKIKPYVCNYCSKSFNEKGNLKTHIRIHTGERPFICKKCKKSFKALGQLKDHYISHTGLKPFQCPFCHKYYRRKEILKNHFSIHKKERLFMKNEEKYEEMLNNINMMKNMVLCFDDCNFVCKNDKKIITSNVNIIHSTGTGNETNLSSFSSNDDSKQSFNNNIIQDKKEKDNKMILNEVKQKSKEMDENESKILKERKDKKEQISFNFSPFNELNQESNFSNDTFDLNQPNNTDIILTNTFNLNGKNEEINDIYFNEEINIESKDFPFQKLPDINEKEMFISSNLNNSKNYNNNLYFSEEKSDKDNENYDCYSKITNLYFQQYQHKINFNI